MTGEMFFAYLASTPADDPPHLADGHLVETLSGAAEYTT